MTIGQDHKQAWFSGSMQRWIAGSFIPNGTSDPATVYGRGFSVAYVSAGIWRVTLDKAFAGFVSLVPGIGFDTDEAGVREIKFGDRSVANRTFEIKVLTSADTMADHPDPDAISASGVANWISFICVVATADVAGAGV